MLTRPPIVQFGTGRFLQAHVDLFVSEALSHGQALGRIAVVQSTDSPVSDARLAALRTGAGFEIRIRGIEAGATIDRQVHVDAVGEALHLARDWQRLRDVFVQARVVVSNTADAGFAVDDSDGPALLREPDRIPASFPARLLVLLLHRWREVGPETLTLLPTELVHANGETLRGIVHGLGRRWQAPDDFLDYLLEGCVWADSLVDRIVAEPLHPLGAVAEPYALWAIERQPGLVLPCTHPAILLTDDLAAHERLKLFVLNLGHTVLADRWLRHEMPAGVEKVLDAMAHEPTRLELEDVWQEEILPAFDAIDLGARARAYIDTVRDRLRNPFLRHALADIAQNHAEKKRRRVGAFLEFADGLGLAPTQRRLRALAGR